jgi:hypothetical protein
VSARCIIHQIREGYFQTFASFHFPFNGKSLLLYSLPSFCGQFRCLHPKNKHADFSLRSASFEPSKTSPKPPFITSPQPTPPPLCNEIQVAPLKASPTKFWHCHVSRKLRAVINIGSFSEKENLFPKHRDDHDPKTIGAVNRFLFYGFIKCFGNFYTLPSASA